MTKRIAIIQGRPDPSGTRFLHARAAAYTEGARSRGHAVRTVDVAQMAFPLLRTKEEYEQGPPPEAILHAQETIAWAGHLVIFYPLWLGTMPALLKGFLEQALRPGFAYAPPQEAGMMKGLLKERSARIVVSMGMPALIYRWYFGAHS
jgi:putative NADPH-quinone reductase